MKFLENIDMRPYNTFQVPCLAKYFVVVESKEDFLEVLESEIYKNNKVLFLGGWSNILLTQDSYDGLVIKNEIKGKEIIQETDDEVTLAVGAGENRDSFVKRSIKKWRYGLENLISIPWTVGAAPMQNIWAYGVEVGDRVSNVGWIDLPSKTEIILANYECNFWYRESVFKYELNKLFFITTVSFTLKKYRSETYVPILEYWAIKAKLEEQGIDDKEVTPMIMADTIAEIRAGKLPDRKSTGTAWSFFKNPIVSKDQYKNLQQLDSTIKGYPIEFEWKQVPMMKLNAGQLIDLAWLKGLQQGNVWTYHKHALILVNNWWGTWKDLVALSERIQKIVLETFGVSIEPEVNFVE